jgi:hypothetical protein
MADWVLLPNSHTKSLGYILFYFIFTLSVVTTFCTAIGVRINVKVILPYKYYADGGQGLTIFLPYFILVSAIVCIKLKVC